MPFADASAHVPPAEVVERDGDDVVAADDTRLGKSVLGTELDFEFHLL